MAAARLVPFLALALSAACAAPAGPPPDAAASPYAVEFGPEEVTLSVRDGGAIPMVEFVRIAQRVTGRVITYRAADMQDEALVRFVGTLRIPNDSFFSFFQTTLYVHGFACTEHTQGGVEVVEVVRREGAPTG